MAIQGDDHGDIMFASTMHPFVLRNRNDPARETDTHDPGLIMPLSDQNSSCLILLVQESRCLQGPKTW